jgi:hypothetical protein
MDCRYIDDRAPVRNPRLYEILGACQGHEDDLQAAWSQNLYRAGQLRFANDPQDIQASIAMRARRGAGEGAQTSSDRGRKDWFVQGARREKDVPQTPAASRLDRFVVLRVQVHRGRLS